MIRKTLTLLAACTLLTALASPIANAGPKAAAHKTGEYVEDSALTTKVKGALMHAKHLKSMHIDVESTEGVVTLSGTVPSEAQIDQAVSVTKHVKGVNDVHNSLTVKVTDKD
jgi:hyperosmotically inducible protein